MSKEAKKYGKYFYMLFVEKTKRRIPLHKTV